MYIPLQYSYKSRISWSYKLFEWEQSPLTSLDGGGHLFEGFAVCVVNMTICTGAFIFTPMNVHINPFLKLTLEQISSYLGSGLVFPNNN